MNAVRYVSSAQFYGGYLWNTSPQMLFVSGVRCGIGYIYIRQAVPFRFYRQQDEKTKIEINVFITGDSVYIILALWIELRSWTIPGDDVRRTQSIKASK